MTDTHDPPAHDVALPDDSSWWACIQLACDALDGKVPNPAPGADSYHDTSIPPPPWVRDAQRIGKIGRLVFYRTAPPEPAP